MASSVEEAPARRRVMKASRSDASSYGLLAVELVIRISILVFLIAERMKAMKNSVLVFLAVLMLFLPLTACAQGTEEQVTDPATQTTAEPAAIPETWQEAYTAIMQAHNDGVGGSFFLLDADRDGTPELYRQMNLRGNEIYISDFARDRTEVLSDFSVSEMYFDQAAGTLGVYHRDGGPADDFGMPNLESFGEYRYADGDYACLMFLRHNWVTKDAGEVNVPELEQITMDGKDISLDDYDAHAVAFREKYDAYEIQMYGYEEGMDLNACWVQ